MSKRSACAPHPQPVGCETGYLHPWKTVGGASRDRTDDLKLAKLALSQLSYGPALTGSHQSSTLMGSLMVGRVGVEPTTSRLSGVRSNHLSYRPPSQAQLNHYGSRRREPAQASVSVEPD